MGTGGRETRRYMKLWTKATRYRETLRHLRLVQIRYLIRYRVIRRFLPASPLTGDLQPALRSPTGVWISPIVKSKSWLGGECFRFLNETRRIATSQDWNSSDCSKLWLYNLHYFDYLCQSSPADGQIIDRWVHDNPAGTGNGWEPYPTSLRIVNWLKWHLAGKQLSGGRVTSLSQQVRWLEHNLEFHLLANHLWANAKALVFAGAVFDGKTSERWLSTGVSLVDRELAEQVLGDGGHFERSPMYHAIVLEDVLDLINLCEHYRIAPLNAMRECLKDVAARMLQWLAAMCHPDGDIAFFNDATLGSAPRFAALAGYAERLGIQFDCRLPGTQGLVNLPVTGFARLCCGTLTLLADVGNVGPSYQPGHAHAESLSFEVSVDDRRVLVNSGISEYLAGPERIRQRSSAAHNCLVVRDVDTSAVWGAHRVGRRARARVCGIEPTRLEAVHDGYCRLRNVGEHRRTWTLSEDSVTITDILCGAGTQPVSVFFHVHPKWRVRQTAESSVVLDDGRSLLELQCRGLPLRVVADSYQPEFGRRENASVVHVYGDLSLPGEIVTVLRLV